jgi:hypothetical protein
MKYRVLGSFNDRWRIVVSIFCVHDEAGESYTCAEDVEPTGAIALMAALDCNELIYANLSDDALSCGCINR